MYETICNRPRAASRTRSRFVNLADALTFAIFVVGVAGWLLSFVSTIAMLAYRDRSRSILELLASSLNGARER